MRPSRAHERSFRALLELRWPRQPCRQDGGSRAVRQHARCLPRLPLATRLVDKDYLARAMAASANVAEIGMLEAAYDAMDTTTGVGGAASSSSGGVSGPAK